MDLVADHEDIKPQLTFEGFLELTKQDDWPEKLTSESLAEIDDVRSEFGSAEFFLEQLKSSISTELSPLEALSERLNVFESRLQTYTDLLYLLRIETGDDEHASRANDGVADPAFVTQPLDLQPQTLRAGADGPELAISDLLAFEETAVERCAFPGFSISALTTLPGTLEPLLVLNAITTAQAFLPGFKKFWKAIFLSEASVAILQDSVWWMFIDRFQAAEKNAKDRLFDRIADSFVAMTMSIHQELKDKVFTIYSDCLAQAVYIAFYWAFPASRQIFDDKFRKYLATTTHEWVNGTSPPAGSWLKWDISIIGSNSTTGGVRLAQTAAVAAIAHGAKPPTLNVDDVRKAVEELCPRPDDPDLDRKSDLHVKSVSFIDELDDELENIPEVREAVSKVPDKKRKTKVGSVDVGPNFERVLFNPKARSLLVLHFLRMRQLLTKEYAKQRVVRTQILRQTPTQEVSTALVVVPQESPAKPTKSFDQISQSTVEEFARLDKHQDDVTRKIQRLQELLSM